MSALDQQTEVIRNRPGFIAALDQSGGSTPNALAEYGIDKSTWHTDEEMFELVHKMRTRIIKANSFNSTHILGTILFEDTLNRTIDESPTGDYLWHTKGIVPFLKVDQGLAPETDGVQMMKPMPKLASSLAIAMQQAVFGTKMRSVIRQANESGIRALVAQQFEFAERINDNGLLPIVEPEVDIHCPDKSSAETMLKNAISDSLDQLKSNRLVMLKLTLPEVDDFYAEFVTHPNVLKVVALSGGFSREEANERLSRQQGVIASFSRALMEGVHANQTDKEFNESLRLSIESIYNASITKQRINVA